MYLPSPPQASLVRCRVAASQAHNTRRQGCSCGACLRHTLHLCIQSPACGATVTCLAANRRIYELVIFNRYSSVASLLIFGNKDGRGGAPRRPSLGMGRRGAPSVPGRIWCAAAPTGIRRSRLVMHHAVQSGGFGCGRRKNTAGEGAVGPRRCGARQDPPYAAGAPADYRKWWAPNIRLEGRLQPRQL